MKKIPGKRLLTVLFPGISAQSVLLFLQDLKRALDLLNAFLIAKGTVVQTQIVLCHICPVNAHKAFRQVFLALVILMHELLNILCAAAELFACLADTETQSP